MSDSADHPLLEVRNLVTRFSTQEGDLIAVDGISFDIERGQRFGIVGESGSGKSATLWSIIGLIDPPGSVVADRISFDGVDMLGMSREERRRIRGSRIGFVMQDPLAALSPVFTVGEQIAETIRCHESVSRSEAKRRAIEILDSVGIPDAAERVRTYPHELSGGMRQRVAIAIALACNPALVIADEPTTALDVTIQAQVLELLEELCKERGVAVLVVTHDLGVIGRFADHVAVMYAGRIVEQGPTEQLLRSPRHPYTEALLVSQPRLDSERRAELPAIPGAPPNLLRRTPGCAFQPRCHRSNGRERCCEDDPVLHAVEAEHASACHFSDELGEIGAASRDG
ncbi:MAG: ABC transporter ATP-binding protein [Thermoleophilia bacterium]|nr:ABC transporter ATP-binding protein [Thermoleophilia bacterium]